MTAENEGVVERLRKRAAAFNDAGLRYGVADLLNEAADAHDSLLDRLRTAEAELAGTSRVLVQTEGALDKARARAAEAEAVIAKVRAYADDRAFHARGHLNTVNSGRIASDLQAIITTYRAGADQ